MFDLLVWRALKCYHIVAMNSITPNTIRKLGAFEQALYLSDQHAPFNVVSAVRLQNPPAPEKLKLAFEVLQKRHPFLRAIIRDGRFEYLSNPTVTLNFLVAPDSPNWMTFVERELNTRLDPAKSLFRCFYLYDKLQADLILTFNHAILDSSSGINLLDELLSLCADENPALPVLVVAPPAEEQFPPAFKGLRGFITTMKYVSAQMLDEIQYRWRMREKKEMAVHLGSHGFALTLTLPETLVDSLSRNCRVEKVTLNSLLTAAILQTANRFFRDGQLVPMRTFSFADLRPYTFPPTSAEYLANYISMLRYTMDVSGEMDIWDLTKEYHSKIYRSLKQGDKFIASNLSKSLVKVFVTLKSMRMGAVGLNYSGAVPLKDQYRNTHVVGLHIFISAFDLGPEINAQARLFKDELWLDFTFLETDMDRETAEKVVGEIRSVLEKAGASLH